jgi:hypothetical protein
VSESTEPADVRDAPQTSSNQPKTEPMPPSPAAEAPEFADPEVAQVPETASREGPETPVPSPGFVSDEHGHVAVSTFAAAGTSEQTNPAEGIRTTALAQPGKPDGEVAT